MGRRVGGWRRLLPGGGGACWPPAARPWISRPGDPMAPYAPRLGFDPAPVRRNIGRFLDSRTEKERVARELREHVALHVLERHGRFHACYYGKMGYLDDQAFTYDLALAAMAISCSIAPTARSTSSARWRRTSTFGNGTYGIYNSYLVSSRIPVEDLAMGATATACTPGRRSAALAALNHMKLQRNTRFRVRPRHDRVVPVGTDVLPFSGRRARRDFDGHGLGPDWRKIFSTEHNVDYFSVLRDAARGLPRIAGRSPARSSGAEEGG